MNPKFQRRRLFFSVDGRKKVKDETGWVEQEEDKNICNQETIRKLQTRRWTSQIFLATSKFLIPLGSKLIIIREASIDQLFYCWIFMSFLWSSRERNVPDPTELLFNRKICEIGAILEEEIKVWATTEYQMRRRWSLVNKYFHRKSEQEMFFLEKLRFTLEQSLAYLSPH